MNELKIGDLVKLHSRSGEDISSFGYITKIEGSDVYVQWLGTIAPSTASGGYQILYVKGWRDCYVKFVECMNNTADNKCK